MKLRRSRPYTSMEGNPMPEAYGTVILKVNKEIEDKLFESDGLVLKSTIVELLNGIGIDGEKIANNFSQERRGNVVIEIDLKNGLPLEGQQKRAAGYIYMPMFGSEWVGFCYLISNFGKGIELYARMTDEYGSRYCFGLNKAGKMFRAEKHKWKQYIPKDVLDNFTGLV